MKTTVDIASNILENCRQVARAENTTIRALVEEGLELALERRASRPKARIKPVVFGGKGLQPEFRDADWSRIRDAAYEGRGS